MLRSLISALIFITLLSSSPPQMAVANEHVEPNSIGDGWQTMPPSRCIADGDSNACNVIGDGWQTMPPSRHVAEDAYTIVDIVLCFASENCLDRFLADYSQVIHSGLGL